jgi:hypothetical protein
MNPPLESAGFGLQDHRWNAHGGFVLIIIKKLEMFASVQYSFRYKRWHSCGVLHPGTVPETSQMVNGMKGLF